MRLLGYCVAHAPSQSRLDAALSNLRGSVSPLPVIALIALVVLFARSQGVMIALVTSSGHLSVNLRSPLI